MDLPLTKVKIHELSVEMSIGPPKVIYPINTLGLQRGTPKWAQVTTEDHPEAFFRAPCWIWGVTI